MKTLLQESGTPTVSLLTSFSSPLHPYRIKFLACRIIEVSTDRVSAPSFHFPLSTESKLNVHKMFKDEQFHKNYFFPNKLGGILAQSYFVKFSVK